MKRLEARQFAAERNAPTARDLCKALTPFPKSTGVWVGDGACLVPVTSVKRGTDVVMLVVSYEGWSEPAVEPAVEFPSPMTVSSLIDALRAGQDTERVVVVDADDASLGSIGVDREAVVGDAVRGVEDIDACPECGQRKCFIELESHWFESYEDMTLTFLVQPD
jgi:hypothetical protein